MRLHSRASGIVTDCFPESTATNVQLIDCQFGKAARENELARKTALIAELDTKLVEQQERSLRPKGGFSGKKDPIESLTWDAKMLERNSVLRSPAYLSPSGSPLPVYVHTPPPQSPVMSVKAESTSFFRSRRFTWSLKGRRGTVA